MTDIARIDVRKCFSCGQRLPEDGRKPQDPWKHIPMNELQLYKEALDHYLAVVTPNERRKLDEKSQALNARINLAHTRRQALLESLARINSRKASVAE